MDSGKPVSVVMGPSPASYGTASAVPADGLTPEGLAARTRQEKMLWRWNLVCGLFHLIQAIIVVALGKGSSKIAAFGIPQTTVFASWAKGYPEQDLRVRYVLPFVAMTSGFAFMSAAAHFIVLAFYKHYIADLRNGMNKFRWYEYAASSSLMLVLIAMLFGMYDIVSLTLLGSVNGLMNLFGYMMESINQYTPLNKPDWVPFWFGCVAGVIPWACIFTYLGASASTSTGDIPGFVWAILIVYVIAFNTFPINMVLQYKRVSRWRPKLWDGRGSDGYYFGEKLYQVQSLVSKSILLWLVVGGANQPNRYTS